MNDAMFSVLLKTVDRELFDNYNDYKSRITAIKNARRGQQETTPTDQVESYADKFIESMHENIKSDQSFVVITGAFLVAIIVNYVFGFELYYPKDTGNEIINKIYFYQLLINTGLLVVFSNILSSVLTFHSHINTKADYKKLNLKRFSNAGSLTKMLLLVAVFLILIGLGKLVPHLVISKCEPVFPGNVFVILIYIVWSILLLIPYFRMYCAQKIVDEITEGTFDRS